MATVDPRELRGFDDVTLLETPIALRPHGTKFERDVTIDLPRTLGSRNRPARELRVLRLDDEDDRSYDELRDFEVREESVRFAVRRFSVYAIALVEAPQDASAGDAAMDGAAGDAAMDASGQDGGTDSGAQDAAADATAQDAAPDAAPQDAAADATDAATDAGDLDASMCDEVDEPCCAASTCGGGLACAGELCSCVSTIGGDHYVRTDGTVRRSTGGSESNIVRADTFAPLDGLIQVVQGHNHGCGVRSDTTVWCWALNGSNPNSVGELGNGVTGGSPTQYQAYQVQVESMDENPAYLTGVTSLQTGASMCYLQQTNCAVKEDGTLWCWGATTDGDLLNSLPANTNSPYAVQIEASMGTPLTGVDAVTVGRRHACVLRGGVVSCWGTNIGGALGIGSGDASTRTYPQPIVVITDPVDEVGAGSDAACARVGTDVYCWGSTGSGQVGLGTPSEDTDGCINYCKLTPTLVQDGTGALGDVARLHMGYLHTCAIKTDGSLWCWGSSQTFVATAIEDPLGAADAGFVPMTDTALLSACGSGSYTSSARILTTDGRLRRGHGSSGLYAPVCE